MTKSLLLLFALVSMAMGTTLSQQVVITDFPLGVGGSVDPAFFKPYAADLRAIAETLQKNPLSKAVITGGADGMRFQQNTDAKNPGLALGRAHALRNWLIAEFQVDSLRLVIQSKDVALKGSRYRCVSVRVVEEASEKEPGLAPSANSPAAAPLAVESRPLQSDLVEHMGLQVAAGASSSPYGGIPTVSGAVTWKRIVYVEGVFGYTLWSSTYRLQSLNIETRRRIAGGAIIVYPWKLIPVGIVGGWRRVEDLSQQYYAYVRLSEGPYFGLRASLFNCLSITGAYNPSRQRLAGATLSTAQDDRFLLSIMVHKTFGGAR